MSMTTDELYAKLTASNETQTKILTEKIESVIGPIEKQIQECQHAVAKLSEITIQQERRLRKNNIVVFGLPTFKNLLNDSLETLNNLLGLKITVSEINNIRIIGKVSTVNRPVLIEFISYLTKADIYKNVSKLKGTKISIAHDLCTADRDRHRILVKHLKIAQSRNLVAQIKGYKLVVDGKLFTAEELEQGAGTTDCEDTTSEYDVGDNRDDQLNQEEDCDATKTTPEQLAKKRKFVKNAKPIVFTEEVIASGPDNRIVTRKVAKTL